MNRLCVASGGVLMILGGLALARYSSAKQSHASRNTQARFVGAWKLLSTEEKLKDGSSRPFQNMGPRATGYLVYTADGHMCAELSGTDRPSWDAPATSAQKIAATETFVAYCGRFEVDEPNQVMWHFPDVALDPSFVGTKQRRPYRFEGHRLIFSDKEPPGGDQAVDRWSIVWEKVK